MGITARVAWVQVCMEELSGTKGLGRIGLSFYQEQHCTRQTVEGWSLR